jgi:hypothetical protein
LRQQTRTSNRFGEDPVHLAQVRNGHCRINIANHARDR